MDLDFGPGWFLLLLDKAILALSTSSMSLTYDRPHRSNEQFYSRISHNYYLFDREVLESD